MKKRYFIIVLIAIAAIFLLFGNNITEILAPLNRVDVVGGFKTNIDSGSISFVRYVVDYKYYRKPICVKSSLFLFENDCRERKIEKFKTLIYVYDITSKSLILKKDISNSATNLELYKERQTFPDEEYVCDYNFIENGIEIFSNRNCLSSAFPLNKISYHFSQIEIDKSIKNNLSNLKKNNPFSGRLMGVGTKGSERFRFQESFHNFYKPLRVGINNHFNETDYIFADENLDKYTNDDMALSNKISSFVDLIISKSGL
ncbi:MAG: hypothetical protein WC668_01825 [Patescibacteria group bacterium]|jgi:hypothetical protein